MSKWTEGPWEIGKVLPPYDVAVHEISSPNSPCWIAAIGPCDGIEQAQANARLISQAPTLAQKLADTVKWLEREIEWQKCNVPDRGLIEKFEKLRDDLAETLKELEKR